MKGRSVTIFRQYHCSICQPRLCLNSKVDHLYSAHPELFGMRINRLPLKVKDDGSSYQYEYAKNEEGYVTEWVEKLSYGDRYTYIYTWE